MNGSNRVGELDQAPLHLCPVCLRKLHYVTGLDLEGRYRELQSNYAGMGLEEERIFSARRLDRMRGR